MVKPDAFARGLSGEIIARFERRGLTLRAVRLLRVTEELAGQHYEEHVDKPFYPRAGRVHHLGTGHRDGDRGPGRRSTVRTMMGATNPLDSAPGTIRGDFALEIGQNIIHGSDSPESAEREIAIYFSPDQLV